MVVNGSWIVNGVGAPLLPGTSLAPSRRQTTSGLTAHLPGTSVSPGSVTASCVAAAAQTLNAPGWAAGASAKPARQTLEAVGPQTASDGSAQALITAALVLVTRFMFGVNEPLSSVLVGKSIS